jgi:hypothetical protein
LSHTSPFCFRYLSYKVWLYFRVSLDINLPIYASCKAEITDAYHHALVLLIEMKSQELFAQACVEAQSSQCLPPH